MKYIKNDILEKILSSSKNLHVTLHDFNSCLIDANEAYSFDDVVNELKTRFKKESLQRELERTKNILACEFLETQDALAREAVETTEQIIRDLDRPDPSGSPSNLLFNAPSSPKRQRKDSRTDDIPSL